MADAPFTRHPHDAVPLNRNVAPIPECRMSPALQDGSVIKVVDVPVLGCASVWLRCQHEAERWISDCDGDVMRDKPELINARINAAYAWLWLSDPRFQWAGLAAFASKQVGCGLLHSAEMVSHSEANLAEESKKFGGTLLPGAAMENVTIKGAQYMKRQLAVANRSLFLDIYPLHRFFTLRGIAGIQECLAERQRIREKVKWDVTEKLPFGLPFKEILAGFQAIERNELQESVKQLATHEQVNVLQTILYDDPLTRALLDANQAAWVTGMPSGKFEEIQLTLSSQCKPKRGFSIALKRSLAVKLWDKDERMEFVLRAAKDFDRLLHTQRNLVAQSIKSIYYGRGVQ